MNKINMLAVFGAVAAATVLLPLQSAEAAMKLKCACETNAKSTLEKTKNSEVSKLSCAETFKGHSSSVSVQESHLKMYVDSSNVKQADLDMNIRFRPRNSGNCLFVATDRQRNKDVWGGMHCNTDSYRDTGQFEIRLDKNSGSYVAKYSAGTTNKTYGGAVMFSTNAQNPSDRTLYMTAACIEDK